MTLHPPIDALFASPPPDLSDDEAASLARSYYGLQGALTRLTSERDLNFLLVTTDASYVLKLANPAEPALITNFQTMALLHLQTTAPHLAVPRVIPSLTGASETALPQGMLRLLSYLPGMMLHAAPPGPGLRRAIAREAARLALGLGTFRHPAASHVLLWDIKQAASLRPLLGAIADPARQVQAARWVDRFAAEIAPRLPQCRWQVVHGDLNPHNLLVYPANPGRICGILDFGDMVETPLICDLAIAASYQIDPAQPLQSLAEMAGAYHAVLPLAATELDLLPALIITRMITTLAITAARAARYPENAAYILRNLATSLQGLDALTALPAKATRAAILHACAPE